MRTSILFLFAILSFSNILGQLPQCNLQLEVEPLLPRPYFMDSGDVSPDLYLKITNLGPDDLDTTDFVYLSGNVKAIDTGTLGKKYLEPGDEMTIYYGKMAHNFSIPGSPITYLLCPHLMFTDTTNHFFQDPDPENDSICMTFVLRGTTPDETNIQIPNTAHFSIYPNPTSGSINIRSEEKISGWHAICVYDIQGRQLYRREEMLGGKGDTHIDITSLQPGVYILELCDAEGLTQREKILKY